LEGLALKDVGILFGNLVYFTAIRYSFVTILDVLWLFYVFFPVLVRCTEKNLATLGVSDNYVHVKACEPRVCP
jgi:hypothetical protein